MQGQWRHNCQAKPPVTIVGGFDAPKNSRFGHQRNALIDVVFDAVTQQATQNGSRPVAVGHKTRDIDVATAQNAFPTSGVRPFSLRESIPFFDAKSQNNIRICTKIWRNADTQTYLKRSIVSIPFKHHI